MKKINPFSPNSFVSPGMFVGRLNEIHELENGLNQTKLLSSKNYIVTGERGIGKSSLLTYLKYIAQGKILVDDTKFNYLVIDITISKETTIESFVEKIEINLRHELSKTEKARKFFSEAWEFIQRIKILDSSIGSKDKSRKSSEIIFEEFCISLIKTLERITNKDEKTKEVFDTNYDGIILLIDECDNISPILNFGYYLKILTEKLHKFEMSKLMIVLAGLPELRDKLINSHPSSLRIFQELEILQLSYDEIESVIKIGLKKAFELNNIETKISDTAKFALRNLSEGYPHFIQQFCYSVYEHDSDNSIDENDVFESALKKGGAIDEIGDRYYRNDYYKKIQSNDYRQVLNIMAEKSNSWISKKEISLLFKGDKKKLDNALQALRDRHIIISSDKERGKYRLQYKGFAIWIKLFSKGHDKEFIKNVIIKTS